MKCLNLSFVAPFLGNANIVREGRYTIHGAEDWSVVCNGGISGHIHLLFVARLCSFLIITSVIRSLNAAVCSSTTGQHLFCSFYVAVFSAEVMGHFPGYM